MGISAKFRSTPVKYFAEAFIRKGASVGNYLWVDSQDIAGIDKTPLRQCDNWILGRQKDVREVRRTREEIFKNTPTEREIMTLKVGYFYACIGNDVHLVYVQPSWLSEEIARKVALGQIPVEDVYKGFKASKIMEKASDRILWKERFNLQKRNREQLEKVVKGLRELKEVLEGKVETLTKKLRRAEQDLKLFDELKNVFVKLFPKKAIKTTEVPVTNKTTLDLEYKELIVNINHKEETIKLTTEIQQGQIMYVALNDMPKEGFTENQISEALKEHGWNIPHTSLAPQLSSNLVKSGLLIKIEGTRPTRYRVPTKIKIKVVKS